MAHIQEANDKSTRSFKKLNTKYQKMFLIAASTGGIIETEINEEAKMFFKQSSVLNAQIFLNSLFEAESLDASVSSAVTSSFMHGSLLWKDELTPSGLAASVLSSQDIIKSNLLEEGIVLDYSTKHEIISFIGKIDKNTSHLSKGY